MLHFLEIPHEIGGFLAHYPSKYSIFFLDFVNYPQIVPEQVVSMITPWKFNIAPENGWLEDYFPIGMVYFQVPC